MSQTIIEKLLNQIDGALSVTGNREVMVESESAFRNHAIDTLIDIAVFGDEHEKAVARWLIWEGGLAVGVYAASINELYMARGAGKTPHNFTVPAMNMRALTYDKASAAFRAARKLNAGAMLFEIARSEIGYTDQRPAEYAICILAAAIKSGYSGPVFIQGDHFQVSHQRFVANALEEVTKVKELCSEAMLAGFYNIDIDTSTLVDLSQPTLAEQQYLNAHHCADITLYVRQHQPQGVEVSLGGEIGEVGEKNSTVEELNAFMQVYNAELAKLGRYVGISKISVQTGTSHGGVVLPDGSIADVAVDFDTLAKMSEIAREQYHLAGAVQHGASTLPESAFNKFAECTACEIHLATGFQNLMYDHPAFPSELREHMYKWILENHKKSEKNTEEQHIYKERKRAIGAFKKDLWHMNADAKAEIMTALEEKFARLFELLNIKDTTLLVQQVTTPVKVHKTLADFGIIEVEQEDVSDLAD